MSSLLARFRFSSFGLILLFLAWETPQALGQSEAEGLSSSFRKASRRVLPAVVTVRPLGVPNPFEPAQGIAVSPLPAESGGVRVPREAGGSGVVIDASRGLILTNDHVIQGASRVIVVLSNGRERPVREVRRDPKSDIALLAVDPTGLVQADWGDSEPLDIGDWVLAIGQPFGLSGTVTAGIISGKGRGIGLALYEDLIQTDAAINPGNSGGPLINIRGEVVGINTAIKTQGGGYEGVGFALPSARARRVAAELAEFGRVRRSYLGVGIRPVDPQTADRLGTNGAAMITRVDSSGPAALAGLIVGDVILKVNGVDVQGPGPLQSLIEVAKVGEPLTLILDRAGQLQERQVRPEPQPDRYAMPVGAGVSVVQPPGININVPGVQMNIPGPNINIGPPPVTVQGELEPPINQNALPPAERPSLRSRPIDAPAPPSPPPPPAQTGPQETAARTPTRFPELGLRLSDPSSAIIRRFQFDREPKGVVVIGVEPDGPADRGGLEVGMVITDAGGRKVANLVEFREAMANRAKDRDMLIRILKGNKAEFRVILDSSSSATTSTPDLDPLPVPLPSARPPGGDSPEPNPPRPRP